MTLSTFARLLGMAALTLTAARAESWRVQYFYDQQRSNLYIADLAFPTAQRGVAVGFVEEGEKMRGTAVVTSDGGAHWSLVRLPDPAIAVHFLNDTTGWVVTTKGILRTDEGGRSWSKLPKSPKDVLRVWFLDAQHGFAVGQKKSAWETKDGGRQWTRLAALSDVKTSVDYTTFSNINFVGPMGMITGTSRAPRFDEPELPAWMEPEKAARRREWPNVSVSLETPDAGRTWKPSTVSNFGQITRVHMARDGRALAVVEFQNAFPYPGEVYGISWKDGKSGRVFREKDRAVTDAALVNGGPAFLAAIEQPTVLRSPLPGRLHMLASTDLKQWREMAVDYRASARRAIVAAVDAANAWVATDTGMILKLEP